MIKIITSTNNLGHTLESRFEMTFVYEFTADDALITAGYGATEKLNVAMRASQALERAPSEFLKLYIKTENTYPITSPHLNIESGRLDNYSCSA